MSSARSLIGYRIDEIKCSDWSRDHVDIFGRKWFWQRSRLLMTVRIYHGRSSDVCGGDGNFLDFSEFTQ